MGPRTERVKKGERAPEEDGEAHRARRATSQGLIAGAEGSEENLLVSLYCLGRVLGILFQYRWEGNVLLSTDTNTPDGVYLSSC